jgi:hypothetical protein
MPIARLLEKGSVEENASFGPDEIKLLVGAFEDALQTLQVDRNDPAALALARKSLSLRGRANVTPYYCAGAHCT